MIESLVRITAGQSPHCGRLGRVVGKADDCWVVRLCDDWSVRLVLRPSMFKLA